MRDGDKFQAIRKSDDKPVRGGTTFTCKGLVSFVGNKKTESYEWYDAEIEGCPLPMNFTETPRYYQFHTRHYKFVPVQLVERNSYR